VCYSRYRREEMDAVIAMIVLALIMWVTKPFRKENDD
jgi:hypothetical protein